MTAVASALGPGADLGLRARDLCKSFGGIRAVNDVSLDFPNAAITALIGPNGAGKTTFFNLISGLLKSDSGRIIYNGTDITRLGPVGRTRLRIGRTFQITSIFPRLTALENVQMALFAGRGVSSNFFKPSKGLFAAECIEALKEVQLEGLRDTKAGQLSHGDRKRLELAIVLALSPSLLLLDEPTAGMGAAERVSAVALIARLARDRSMTLVFTEHDMDTVFGIADSVVVMHRGAVIAQGSVDEIRANVLVQESYLGRAGVTVGA